MNNRTIALIAAIVIVAGIVFSFLYTAGYKQAAAPPSAAKKPALVRVITKPKAISAKIYLMRIENNNPILSSTYIQIPADGDHVRDVLQELVNFKDASGFNNPIPEGTKLQSVEIQGDMAIVNFTGQFVDGFTGGSDEESLLVQSIVKTVAQFGNVKRIKLLCDGSPVTTFGHLDIEEPIDAADYK